MKLSGLSLCLPCLGHVVHAADTSWLAVLNNNPVPRSVSRPRELMLKDMGAVHQSTFDLGSLRGYAFSGSEDAAERVAQHPDVAYVHPDYNVSAFGVTKIKTPLWNLEQISQVGKNAEYPYEYRFDDSAGNGAVVYIIDSGIDIANKEFGGRAEWGTTFVDGRHLLLPQTDTYGHGTVVAGVVGSSCCGVAKKAQLVAVKVLNGKGLGRTSDTVQGIQWAANDAKKRGTIGRAVINLSLGSKKKSRDRWRDITVDAINEVVTMGIFVVTAAGNDDSNALETMPGATPAACNVGAHDISGARASFSNHGPGVDIWAPGTNIWAPISSHKKKAKGGASADDTPRFGPHRGTSFAAPHVAGVAAYLMGLNATEFNAAHPNAIDWCERLREMGKGATHGGEVQPLLYNGADGRAHAF